jgi:hypothetical protein
MGGWRRSLEVAFCRWKASSGGGGVGGRARSLSCGGRLPPESLGAAREALGFPVFLIYLSVNKDAMTSLFHHITIWHFGSLYDTLVKRFCVV